MAKSDTSEGQNMSAKKIDFSDMSERDFVAMLMNTAVVGRESGHGVQVKNGRFLQVPSVLIVLPGYRFEDGRVVRVEVEGETAVQEE